MERGEPEYHIDLFKELYAKLDLDDDGAVILDEMLTFERDRQRVNEDLVIAIYWIGFSISETRMNSFPGLKERFYKEGLLENHATD